jgi:chemotaxis protein methyltransferase CheR
VTNPDQRFLDDVPPRSERTGPDLDASPEDGPDVHDLRLVLDTVLQRTGLDFRSYAFSSLRRRVARAVSEMRTGNVYGLHLLLKQDDEALARFVRLITVHTTEMFRDPDFFKALRTQVVPVLKTYPFLRIWIAGCSTGEEVYSVSILLREEGIADRCRIYATDLSDAVLDRARAGIFPLSVMQEYSRNYQMAGGKRPFSDYFVADSEWVVFSRQLRENVVFGTHNLASDASFNEFHLILCRNVLIYFRRELQARVHGLFHESLVTFGYLGLGRSETLRFTPYHDCYDVVNGRERLFRKIK